MPPSPTQLYLVSSRFRRKISFVTSFTISNWLKKYYLSQLKKMELVKKICTITLTVGWLKKKQLDRAERHDFWPRLWLFFSPFLFPLKKEVRRKGEWMSKSVIKSHAFLLDQLLVCWLMLYYYYYNLILACKETQKISNIKIAVLIMHISCIFCYI